MLRQNVKEVGIRHVPVRYARSALDDGTGLRADTLGHALTGTVLHLTLDGVLVAHKREIVLDIGHVCTEHTLVYLVALVAQLHKKLFLNPVRKLLQLRIKRFLYLLYYLFRHTHATVRRLAHRHLVNHIQISQLGLRELVFTLSGTIVIRHLCHRQRIHIAIKRSIGIRHLSQTTNYLVCAE